ncbi:type IV pilin N-terminal domain-containing protein [Halomicroarcula sp. S1AR25-4]|uniref:type IV pilin N-terminal domain-containing protein n=1 Tax=Haloarcula sp. S1AR25-4 TaxID=2950538 RepID=UPI0028754592|nr:type IV pilin N-terminal domain-containing protein [Halomicroarcula sp. S1AR25-4]MDS0280001.1 type IV pilin N-terminal domain-containing protein [Halomicroarcula sp. S1AR25-4]
MKLQELLNDDDAVSPVIGVILMVAITVILAAVIATFVLGLGDSVSNTAPQASFSFDYQDADSDALQITHDGGDTIDGGNLNVTASGAVTANASAQDIIVGADMFTGDVTAGVSDTLDNSTLSKDGVSTTVDNAVAADDQEVDLSSAEVRVIYSGEDGKSSATLGQWNGPDA